jgi:hypothetical protein
LVVLTPPNSVFVVFAPLRTVLVVFPLEPLAETAVETEAAEVGCRNWAMLAFCGPAIALRIALKSPAEALEVMVGVDEVDEVELAAVEAGKVPAAAVADGNCADFDLAAAC